MSKAALVRARLQLRAPRSYPSANAWTSSYRPRGNSDPYGTTMTCGSCPGARERRGGAMPRSRCSSPSRSYSQFRSARRVRWIQRTATTSIALGCLLAITGVVHAQVGHSSGTQAVGTASAISVAGQEEQTVACKISVPPHALTAEGLATPWVLSGDDGGKCEEATA